MNTCLFKENSNKKRPDKNEFYGSLRSKEINDKKHQHVLKVWKKFGTKTMDYHDLHLKHDVFLLADVFGKFRNRCLENNNSCPCHYLSTPALSWDAILS